jgi:mRNA-degrading endonuclease toxin of MazEF toxin-antitoxin module
MTERIQSPIVGGVYYVEDAKLTLLPEGERDVHEHRRPVVVLSGSGTNADPAWRVVLICPISGSTSKKTRFCVKLAAGEGGVSKKCWVRIPAIQPAMKDDLQDLLGVMAEELLNECQGRLVDYLGLVDAGE